MARNAKVLVLASVLPVVVLAGCSNSTSADSPDPSSATFPTPTTAPTTAPTAPTNDGDDDGGETTGGVRIPLGQTKTVQVPADAVMDIKGKQGWDAAVLECTATDASGQSIDLLPPDPSVPPESAAHGGTWTPIWTLAAAPGAVTVGCSDPGAQIQHTETSFIRVVPRGLPAMR